ALHDVSAPPGVPIELPGPGAKEAFATRSLWLVTLGEVFRAPAFAGLGQHFVSYLIGIGYSATFSARTLSVMFLLTIFGNLLSGPMADRINARLVLTGTWALGAIAMFALLGASHVAALGIHVR